LDLTQPRRVDSDLPVDLANRMQYGIMDFTYKGVPTLKCPFDLAIYAELIYRLKPRTILEFGSFKGGSALWLADTVDSFGLSETQIFAMDVNNLAEFRDRRINFRYCDCENIEGTLDRAVVDSIRYPLLIIEDASHMYQHSLNVLEFFHRVSTSGDYIIVEDGIASVVGVEDRYEGGPHKATYDFLRSHPDAYEIDRQLCDRFGVNATWAVDGYIRRTH
jgi:cephalosporin hydroxylase